MLALCSSCIRVCFSSETHKGAFLRLRDSWHVSARARIVRNQYPKSPPDAAALRATVPSDDAARIEAVTQELAKGTEAFAALRMNRGIHKALAGKNIAAV